MSAPVTTRPGIALIATLAIQMYVALGATGMAVLAPVIAPEFGLSQKLVGVFVGLVYAAAMTASLFSGVFIARFGAIRVSQCAVLLVSLGLALLPIAAWAPAGVALLLIAPLVIGAGYGPITPASSHVLVRTAPPSRMALTFSIKQTGVPGGAALGGALLPALTLVLGWHATLLALAGVGIAVAGAAQPIRSDLDRTRDRTRRFTIAGTFKPLRKVLANPRLVEITIVSFFYAALQVSLMSFLVVYLTEALGWSLVSAGFALTVATTGGVAGRVLWGVIADHYVPPRVLLGLLGVIGGACSLATAAYPASGPVMPLLVLAAVFGATAIGWNGVQLAEVARHAPPGEAGAITGATGFIGFSGIVVGSPLFGFLAAATGDYRTGFIVFGGAILSCGTWVLVRCWRSLRKSGEG
jgi:MFS family permease